MKVQHKVELKEIGLDIGLAIARHFYKTDYLHYGCWPEGLAVAPENVREAQENYADLLLRNIPDGVKRILDVGCGSGKFAERLLEEGFSVDCVSPSPTLTRNARVRLGNRAEVFECKFEDLQTDRRYDLILFSESFQYLLLEQALVQSLACLNPGGHLLICDFFKRNVPGKSPVSGGHQIDRFLSFMDSQSFTLLKDEDITAETAPSLDIMRDFIQEVIKPIWEAIAYYMTSNYPRFSALFSRVFQKKIAQAHRKYLSGNTNGEQFAHFKTYRLFLFQQQS